MPPLAFAQDKAGIRIRVRLTPRAGHDRLEGIAVLADGTAVLKARVRAAPENGLANAALERLIAARFSVALSAVAVVSGRTSRVKTVRIVGDTKTLVKVIERL